jgi:hypothetical protein
MIDFTKDKFMDRKWNELNSKLLDELFETKIKKYKATQEFNW